MAINVNRWCLLMLQVLKRINIAFVPCIGNSKKNKFDSAVVYRICIKTFFCKR